MRRFRRSFLVLSIALVTAVPAALPQWLRDHEAEGGVRGFHGEGIGGVRSSFEPDPEARAEFERILSAVGVLPESITLRATAKTQNAEASVGEKSGERFIFYSALFLQKLKQKTADDWSLVGILAHEVGHHVYGHTLTDGNHHKVELQADYFSGFVLRRLGATLDQALAAMREISPETPTRKHPGRADRLQAITLGWINGGTKGPPPGLKVKAPPTPDAQAPKQPSPVEVAAFCKEVAANTSAATLQALAEPHKGTPMAACVQARLPWLRLRPQSRRPPRRRLHRYPRPSRRRPCSILRGRRRR